MSAVQRIKIPGASSDTWNVYGDTLRKVHITYATPLIFDQVGEFFDASKWVHLLKDADVKTVIIYMKDHHGRCYYKTNLGKQYLVDILGMFLPEAHKGGIEVHPYFSVGFDQYAIGNHPDWTTVDASGKVPARAGDIFERPCIISSPYREFAWKQLEDMVSKYDVNGVWYDIGQFYDPCYCYYCRKKYKDKFGEEIPENPNDLPAEGLAFLQSEYKSFYDEAERIIKKYRPDALTGGTSGYDMISIECHQPFYEGQDMIARLGKARKIPTEITSPGSYSGWDGFDSKPATLLKLEIAGALAHGANILIGVAPYVTGAPEPGVFANIKEVFSYVKSVEPYCTKVESVSDVALRYDETIQLYSDYPFRMAPSEFTGFHECLLDEHLQYDFVKGDEDLSKYSLLILADQRNISGDVVKNIAEYVKAGGNLLVTALTSLTKNDFAFSEVMGVHYKRRGHYDFAYMYLKDEMLAKNLPEVPLIITSPIEIELDGAEELATFAYPETAWNSYVCSWLSRPKPKPDSKHYSLITLNRFGQGKCLYVGFQVGAASQSAIRVRGFEETMPKRILYHNDTLYRRLVKNLIGTLLKNRLVETNAPPGVKTVLNKKAEKYILHLVNHHIGSASRVSDGINNLTLTGLEVSIDLKRISDVSKVYSAPDKVNIPYNKEDSRLKLQIPPFDVNAVIVIE